MTEKMIIGNSETCDLPELHIHNLQIRVDTGAKTSSLHVDNIELYEEQGTRWVRFDIHPDIHNVDTTLSCIAPVADSRKIKSSNGSTERRVVIKTLLVLGGEEWPIELTLTDRSDMSYLMLLGREGMGDRVLVDPSTAFLVSEE